MGAVKNEFHDRISDAADVRAAREFLGLSARGLAEALRLGKDGGRTVRRWESGEVAITGPAQVAIELLLEQNKTRARSA